MSARRVGTPGRGTQGCAGSCRAALRQLTGFISGRAFRGSWWEATNKISAGGFRAAQALGELAAIL